MVDPEAIHAGEREATLQAIMDQSSELFNEPTPSVTCPCGAAGPVVEMFRCYFCHVRFCPACAEDHFGETPPIR